MTTLITKLVVRLTYRRRVQARLARVCVADPRLQARIAHAQTEREAAHWDAIWAGRD